MAGNIFDDINPAITSGNELATLLNSFKDAFASGLKGPTRPNNIQESGLWVNDDEEVSGNILKLMMFFNATDIELLSVDVTSGAVVIPTFGESVNLLKSTDDAFGAIISMAKERATGNPQTLPADQLGNIEFRVTDENSVQFVSSLIRSIATDTSTAIAQGSELAISTTATGTAALVERVRIANDGKIGVGTSTPDEVLHVKKQTIAKSKLEQETDDAVGPVVELKKARISGAGQTLNGDKSGTILFKGEEADGTEAELVKIETSTTEDTLSTNHGSSIAISTKDNTTNIYKERIKADSTGITLDGELYSAHSHDGVDTAKIDSANTIFDNTVSKLDAVDAKSAIDEVNANLIREVSTGVFTGGNISIASPVSTFTIADGNGLITDSHTDPNAPTYTRVSWTGHVTVAVTNLATEPATYIAIDSLGAIVQQATPFTSSQHRDLIILGVLIHTGGTQIESVSTDPHFLGSTYNQLIDMAHAIGTINTSGNVYGANGANLNVNRSAGSFFGIGLNYVTSKKNPNFLATASGTALSFIASYQDGVGGFDYDSPVALFDPTLYDDGTGTPATMANNKWQITRLHFDPETSNDVFIRGQAEYSSLEDAEAAIFTATITPNTELDRVPLRGWLLTKKECTDLSDDATAKFIQADKFGSSAPSSGGSGNGGGLDKWVANTAYLIDEVIWYAVDDNIYRCTADNNDATFIPGNWEELSKGGVTSVNGQIGDVEIDVDNYFIKNLENFELRDPAVMFTGSVNITASLETVAPLSGSRSAKFTQTSAIAGNVKYLDTAYEINFEDDTQVGKLIAEKYLAKFSGNDGDQKFVVEFNNGTDWTTLSPVEQDIKSGTEYHELQYYRPATATKYRYGIKIVNANDTHVLYLDKIALDIKPNPTAEFAEVGTYRASGVFNNLAGGLVGMSGLQVEFTGDLFSINAAESEITMLKDVNVSIDGTFPTNVVGTELHLTKNETSIPSVSNSNVLDYGYNQQAANYTAQIGFSGQLRAGDVVRLFCGAGMSTVLNSKFSIKATKVQTNYIVEGAVDEFEWTPYTPITQGYGTITSNELMYRRVGDSVQIMGRFTSGTATAIEGQVGLPSGLVIKSGISITNSGLWFKGNSGNTHGGAVLITGGDTFLNFSSHGVFGGDTIDPLAPTTGANLGSATIMSINATIPIQGWSSQQSTVYAAVSEKFAIVDGEYTDSSRYYEGFEKNTVASYFTANGTGSLATETIAPLEGGSTAKLVAAAANDDFDGASLFVDKPEYKVKAIAFNFLTSATVSFTAFVEAWNGSTWDILNTTSIGTDNKLYKVMFQLADNHTSVRLRPLANGVGSMLIDKISINLDPLPTSEMTVTEVARYNTSGGYSSTNTCIPYFSTEVENSTNKLISIDHNNATLGTSITAIIDCTVNVSFTISVNASNFPVGFSLNSTQLSSNILTITAAHRLAGCNYGQNAEDITVSTEVKMKAGDVLRPHMDGLGIIQNGARNHLNVVAKAASTNVVSEGATSEVDSMVRYSGNVVAGAVGNVVKWNGLQVENLGTAITADVNDEIFTVTENGIYHVDFVVVTNAGGAEAYLQKNTSIQLLSNHIDTLTIGQNQQSTGFDSRATWSGYLKKGETLGVFFSSGLITARSRLTISKAAVNPLYSVPVSDKISPYVSGEGNSGTAYTAGVTNIPFTNLVDETNFWNDINSEFLPTENVKVHISGNTLSTTTLARYVSLWRDTGGGYAQWKKLGEGITDTTNKFEFIGEFEAGYKYAIRIDANSGTLSNNSIHHYMNTHVIKKETAYIADAKTVHHVTGGTEYETNATVDKKTIFGRTWRVATDVTVSNAAYITGLPTTLNPYNVVNNTATFWTIHSVSDGTNSSRITYDSSTGNIGIYLTGTFKVGANVEFTLKYTK